jgi:hypothetical protein
MALTMLLLVACSKNHGAKGGDDGSGFADDSDVVNDTGTQDDSGPVVDDDHDDDGWDDDDDCDDDDPQVHPEAEEQCLNGIDDDCNTVIDRCDLCSQTLTVVAYDWSGWSYLAVDILQTSEQSAAWTIAANGDDKDAIYVMSGRADEPWPAATIGFAGLSAPMDLATRSDLNGDGSDDLIIAGSGSDGEDATSWIFSSPIPDGGLESDQADAMLLGTPDSGGAPMVEALPLLTIGVGEVTDAAIVADAAGTWIVPGPVSGTVTLSADPRILTVADRPYALRSMDLNGDGTRDLLLGGADASETPPAHDRAVRIFLGPLGDALDATNDDRAWTDTRDIGFALATGDFDGDGREDAFVALGHCFLEEPCAASLLTNESAEGDPEEAAASTVLAGEESPLEIIGLDAADFDSDGVADLVVTQPYFGYFDDPARQGRLSILLGPFSGTHSVSDDANVQVSSCKESWERLGADLAIGDYDGDGHPDVLTTSALFGVNLQEVLGGMVRVMPSTSFVEL